MSSARTGWPQEPGPSMPACTKPSGAGYSERSRTALCYGQLCQGCLTWFRPWKCFSAIQTSCEVAQEQMRRLTKNQGSSKKSTPLVGSAHQYTRMRLASSRELPFREGSGLHPALGKPGPLSLSGTFPLHCSETVPGATRDPLPTAMAGAAPRAGLCVWGAPGTAQVAVCWVLQGHELPEPRVPRAQGKAGSGTGQRCTGTVTAAWCLPCPAPQPARSHSPAEPLPQPASAMGMDKAAGTRSQEGARPAHPCSRRQSTSWEAPLLPWWEATPSSRRADGKQSMEFARLKVKYNTHTDFVRGPGTTAFAGSD